MSDITPLSDPELLALPANVPLTLAARAFGVGRGKASELARAKAFPCEVILVGKRYRVNRSTLYEALRFDPDTAAKRLAEAAGSPTPVA